MFSQTNHMVEKEECANKIKIPNKTNNKHKINTSSSCNLHLDTSYRRSQPNNDTNRLYTASRITHNTYYEFILSSIDRHKIQARSPCKPRSKDIVDIHIHTTGYRTTHPIRTTEYLLKIKSWRRRPCSTSQIGLSYLSEIDVSRAESQSKWSHFYRDSGPHHQYYR
jgi:hypothetical protein